jgi:methionyl-tRNA formyltransferase
LKGEHTVIDWTKEAVQVYNLVRGCDPQPGAATTYCGVQVQLFDSRLKLGKSESQPGKITHISDQGVEVALRGGFLLVRRPRISGGAKGSLFEFAQEFGITAGDRLGS